MTYERIFATFDPPEWFFTTSCPHAQPHPRLPVSPHEPPRHCAPRRPNLSPGPHASLDVHRHCFLPACSVSVQMHRLLSVCIPSYTNTPSRVHIHRLGNGWSTYTACPHTPPGVHMHPLASSCTRLKLFPPFFSFLCVKQHTFQKRLPSCAIPTRALHQTRFWLPMQR